VAYRAGKTGRVSQRQRQSPTAVVVIEVVCEIDVELSGRTSPGRGKSADERGVVEGFEFVENQPQVEAEGEIRRECNKGGDESSVPSVPRIPSPHLHPSRLQPGPPTSANLTQPEARRPDRGLKRILTIMAVIEILQQY
jgi:hypothetical protein